MNFLDFHGMIGKGGGEVRLNDVALSVPQSIDGANGSMSFGVRPEHVRLDDGAAYRGRVKATEYLGTTQIVTLETANGDIKARVASSDKVSVGDQTGLTFDPRTITLFDADTGAALRSQANEGVLIHG